MSRTLRFSYEIRLTFSAPVTRHIFVLRCMPPSLPGQQIVSATLTLDPPVPYTVQQDSFGNLLQAGRIDSPHDHFCYGVCGTARMDLSGRQLTRRSPLFCLPSAFTRPSPEMLDWLAALPLPETPRQRAWALARAVHSRLTYAPGATGVATTAAQAFHNGRGVCQDFAHVYLALARQAGLAARYVNGLPQGEGVSHAWCEVWLDGLWTGIDPTRLQWTDEGYLRFGAGRDFGDCPIERGVFLGSARQEQQVFMRVSQQSF